MRIFHLTNRSIKNKKNKKKKFSETIGVTSIIASYVGKPRRTTRVIIINKWQYSRKSKKRRPIKSKSKSFSLQKKKKKKKFPKVSVQYDSSPSSQSPLEIWKRKNKKEMRWSNQCVKLHCLYIPSLGPFTFFFSSLLVSLSAFAQLRWEVKLRQQLLH